MSQPVSTTDIDLSQPAQTDVPVVEGANNGSEPAVNQTEVITSELDTSTTQPADGSNQQQMQLNEFFMSLLSRNSSTASDLEQQMTSSPSDDRPKPGHAAAARSMWEKAIQQRDSAQSRRPGVRSKCVRVDSNANCLQGEGDAVSEVTQSEKDRLEHAKTYRSPHSPIVSPVLSSAHEVESAAEPEEIWSPTATPGIGGIAISRIEISPVKSNSPPTANLPVPVKSSSPPSVDLPVPVNPCQVQFAPYCKPASPCQLQFTPPTADLPVPAKSSSPPTADLPVPAKSSSPPTADLPVPVNSSSPPTADLPVPAKSRSPPTADPVNKGSCTQPSTGPICVSETCKDKQEVSVLTQPAIVNVRANRSRLNLPLEGVTAVVTPKDAEHTCCQLHTTLQETLTMYSQVCSQEDTDEKKKLLRRTLVETRQWIDNTLGDRPPPVTAFLDTVATTGVDTSVAMLEHYSLQLADRVCALVHDRLLPPGDTTHDTKL
ncbi:hypothetical protein LSAT2_012355 [Lamellibrachia satsuma]|nr:hypothetical protein LSAT2_012355 [Lamellibrachia satsuma]